MGIMIKNGKNYSLGSRKVEVDHTLTVDGKAGDSKAIGDAITMRWNSDTGYLEAKVDGIWQQTELSVIESLIPTLSNYTSTEGNCVYSSILSDTYTPWKAFDKNDATLGGCTATSNYSYIGFKWNNVVYVNSVSLTMTYTHGSDTSHSLNLKLQYYNGTDWLDIESSEFNEAFVGGSWQDRNYKFSVNKNVQGVRFYGTVASGSSTWALFIREMQAYGYKLKNKKNVLFSTNNNVGNFALYTGTTNSNSYPYAYGNTSLDVGETLVFKGEWKDSWGSGCLISDSKDLTNYSKLVFSYSANATNPYLYNFMNAFITASKQTSMTSVANKVILNPSATSQEGTIEIDITELSGEHYIGFEISCGSGVVTLNLSEAYLE